MKKSIQALSVLILLTLPFAATSQSAEKNVAIVGLGTYLASDDIGRSAEFYRTLLEREPVVRLEDFIAFGIAGGWFAIVSRDKYARGSVPGSGAVPYIQSGDLEEIQVRASAALGFPAPAIIVEPGISLLKIEDPDGQLIEFFTLTR